MNINSGEDFLALLNRLLEGLHQAGMTNFGSHLSIVYVAPGAQHVGTVQNQYVGPHPSPLQRRGSMAAEKDANPPFDADTQKGEEQEERIKQSIALLMTERYGDEPLFSLQGHWQAVYRILVDKGYCRDSDFDGFDAFIRRVMPDEVNKPYKKDSVRNINKTSFNKPFGKWQYDPDDYGTRKPYDRMVEIARRFKKILEEKGV